jgi:hypothetical protein
MPVLSNVNFHYLQQVNDGSDKLNFFIPDKMIATMLGSGAISVPLPPFSLSLLLICHTNIYIYVSRCLLLGRVGVE